MAYDFNTIATDYDHMNHLMTLGLDKRWRKQTVKRLSKLIPQNSKVLDVACGTGDLAFSLAESSFSVTGADLSEKMLSIAADKKQQHYPDYRIDFQQADVEQLPFADSTFDAITCAFGVRNFVHLERGLKEMLRIMKPEGSMVILELATPDSMIIKPFYNLYTHHIIPWLGSRIADNRKAYTYLPESIDHFPKGKAFMQIIEKLGGKMTEYRLTLGVCRMYIIKKKIK